MCLSAKFQIFLFCFKLLSLQRVLLMTQRSSSQSSTMRICLQNYQTSLAFGERCLSLLLPSSGAPCCLLCSSTYQSQCLAKKVTSFIPQHGSVSVIVGVLALCREFETLCRKGSLQPDTPFSFCHFKDRTFFFSLPLLMSVFVFCLFCQFECSCFWRATIGFSVLCNHQP